MLICYPNRSKHLHLYFFNLHILLPSLNAVNLTLIPKNDKSRSMADWRPIALCNVIYKVVSKVLANRLKHVHAKCVSFEQTAFVSDKSILDRHDCF